MSEPKVSLSELLKEVGDENVQVQFLSSSLDGNQTALKNGDVKITFRSSSISLLALLTGQEKVGLVVWIPKDKMDAARKQLTEGNAHAE